MRGGLAEKKIAAKDGLSKIFLLYYRWILVAGPEHQVLLRIDNRTGWAIVNVRTDMCTAT